MIAVITKINKEKLLELIKSFYNLTGIKVAVYDNRFTEILAYPAYDTTFCALLHKSESGCRKCTQSTENLCKQCVREKRGIIERCHAGLTEAVAPIVDGVSVIGYIMLGQITNECDRERFCQDVTDKCKGYKLCDAELKAAIDEVLYYSDAQLDDAARILNALASGIIHDKIVYYAEISVTQKIVDYIRENLSEDLSVKSLCEVFHLSKSELYRITKGCMPEGIAAFVKKERIKKAADLLKTTNKPSWEIAAETGFSDVNYFLRIFKAVQGIPAGKYREKL